MATATTKLWTDSTTFTFSDSAGSGAGSWATNTNAAWSGGTANSTSTIGDKVTITWTGRALYLFSVLFGSGADFTVTTDGVTRSVKQTNYAQGLNSVYRYPMQIESGLTDGVHTTVLQSVTSSSFTQFMINAIVVVTGTRSTPLANVYDACGDSWSIGSGAPLTSTGYVYQARRRLAARLKADVTLNVRGVSGAGLANKPTQNSANAIEQLILANADQPSYLTLGFGVNDLAVANNNAPMSPGMFAQAWRITLQFIEDLFNTSAIRIVAGTPGYISPAMRYSQLQTAGTVFVGFGGGLDAYETAVVLARQVFDEFTWLRVADVYAAMDRRTALVYPNGQSDLGLHPNEAGHSVVADEFVHALLAA